MSIFKDYYRLTAVRTAERLLSPKTVSVTSMELPRESVLHYLPTDDVEMGISVSSPFIGDEDRNYLVSHVVEYTQTPEGNPRYLSSNVSGFIRDYRKRYRRLRTLRSIEMGLRDRSGLTIMNYAMLNHLYRYIRSPLQMHHEWTNVRRTMWDTVAELQKQGTHNHFIAFELPEVLADIIMFRKYANDRSNRTMFNFFGDYSSLDMLDLWARATGKLPWPENVVPETVNFVFICAGRFAVVNLADLKTYMDDKSNETGAELLFYKFLVKMHELRTPNNVAEATVEEPDLEAPVERPAEEELTANIVAACDDLAERGLLSGGEYRRMMKLSTRYTEIKSPTGEGTLAELVDRRQHAAAKKPVRKIPDIRSVQDKSMLESSIDSFDGMYIDEYMESDMASAVLGLQKAGVAVVDYTYTDTADAVNRYRNYTVKLAPVKGKASTVNFRVPLVNKDGTFLANGVKCRLGKQRVDVPIRKVGPELVALSSYYGKLNVQRSDRSTNNYPKWLEKNLTAASIGQLEGSLIKQVVFGSVFDNYTHVPRVYSAVAQIASNITTEEYSLHFDYHTRTGIVDGDLLMEIEGEDRVVCGTGRRGAILVMDDNNFIYLVKDGNEEYLGTLEDLIGLDRNRAPVEMAEIKIYRDKIPLGVVLSYYLGLDNLLNELRVKYRTVPRGARKDMESDEFAVTFNDVHLIISREDALATIVLNGFNRYHKVVQNYRMTDFDSQDVYYNVFTSNGLNVTHMRELDLMRDMYIDPITRDILVSMKEPTDFVKLLMRAGEYLTIDAHPDETDMRFMRIRGYERMSGLVYKELVGAVRKHRARPTAANSSIDINPKSIWMAMVQDQSTEVVADINPIENLKQHEKITYNGEGGRSARAMVKRSRVYHRTDLGLISESTPDSSKVAVTVFSTANPNFENLRGMTREYDPSVDGTAKILSTTSLLMPASDRD